MTLQRTENTELKGIKGLSQGRAAGIRTTVLPAPVVSWGIPVTTRQDCPPALSSAARCPGHPTLLGNFPISCVNPAANRDGQDLEVDVK